MNYREICRRNPQAFKSSSFVLDKKTGQAKTPKIITSRIKLPDGYICTSFFNKYTHQNA